MRSVIAIHHPGRGPEPCARATAPSMVLRAVCVAVRSAVVDFNAHCARGQG